MIYKHSLKNTQWLRHKVKKSPFIKWAKGGKQHGIGK